MCTINSIFLSRSILMVKELASAEEVGEVPEMSVATTADDELDGTLAGV